MTSVRKAFAFNLLLGGFGLVLVAGVFAVAVAGMSFRPPAPAALAHACMSIVPKLEAGDLLGAAAAVLGLAVAVRGARSAGRQWRLQRRALLALGPLHAARVANTPVFLFEAPDSQAFCAGVLRPRVYVSTAAANGLSTPQLEAVVAHEAHHRHRRDPLRLYLSRVMADALFFLPALRRGHERFASATEIAADQAAVSTAGGPRALASALLAFGQTGNGAGVIGIAPERVDHLVGRPARPRGRGRLAAALVISLLALAMLAGGGALLSGSGQMNLPLLAAQGCMTSMVAAPLALGLVLFRWLSPRVRQPR